jgi:glycine oxidase
MMSSEKTYYIVGQGLAGTLVAYELLKKGCKIKIFDDENENAASLVAAGLINPITGRRLVKSEQIDELLPVAAQLYKELEVFLGIKIWFPTHLLWTLSSQKEENDWALRSSYPEVQQYIIEKPEVGEIKDFFKENISFGEVKHAVQVDLSLLVLTFRDFLKSKNLFFSKKNHEENFSQNTENVIVVFCEGEKARFNPLWSWLPFVVAKGEALKMKLDKMRFSKIIKNEISIIPFSDETYWIGSNYEWNPKDSSPTLAQKDIFLKSFESILDEKYDVISHKAGIRPTTKDRRPMLGFHPENENFIIFNGLGTKGTSLAPFYVKHLMEVIFENKKIEQNVDIQRFMKMDIL